MFYSIAPISVKGNMSYFLVCYTVLLLLELNVNSSMGTLVLRVGSLKAESAKSHLSIMKFRLYLPVVSLKMNFSCPLAHNQSISEAADLMRTK